MRFLVPSKVRPEVQSKRVSPRLLLASSGFSGRWSETASWPAPGNIQPLRRIVVGQQVHILDDDAGEAALRSGRLLFGSNVRPKARTWPAARRLLQGPPLPEAAPGCRDPCRHDSTWTSSSSVQVSCDCSSGRSWTWASMSPKKRASRVRPSKSIFRVQVTSTGVAGLFFSAGCVKSNWPFPGIAIVRERWSRRMCSPPILFSPSVSCANLMEPSSVASPSMTAVARSRPCAAVRRDGQRADRWR